MSRHKERYAFNNGVKREAYARAEEIGVKGPKNVHHIFPRYFAKKYNLDKRIITSQDNAIALEKDTFHAWIHGRQLSRIDEELDWQGFSEADYIFLAITLLGFSESDFQHEKRRKNKSTKRKPKRSKRRRRRN